MHPSSSMLRLRWWYVDRRMHWHYPGSDVMLHCSSGTSLGSLSCCTYTQLHSVYDKLRQFLVWNGPTPNFALTSSCLCFIPWQQLFGSWVTLFPFSLSPKSSITPLWWGVSLQPHSEIHCITSRLTPHNTTYIYVTLCLINRNFTWSTIFLT